MGISLSPRMARRSQDTIPPPTTGPSMSSSPTMRLVELSSMGQNGLAGFLLMIAARLLETCMAPAIRYPTWSSLDPSSRAPSQPSAPARLLRQVHLDQLPPQLLPQLQLQAPAAAPGTMLIVATPRTIARQ